MTDAVRLWGYRFSVYTWIVRWALAERGLDWEDVEADPFSGPVPHPFGRVPLLEAGAFRLYETRAMLDWIAAAPGPALVPEGRAARARMQQVMGIADSYAYWPLVRQVFSHAVFRPASGETADPAEVAAGLDRAAPVLDELERIADEGLVLSGSPTLADFALAPMLDYFARAEAGRAALDRRPRLSERLDRMAGRPAFRRTRPGLPGAEA